MELTLNGSKINLCERSERKHDVSKFANSTRSSATNLIYTWSADKHVEWSCISSCKILKILLKDSINLSWVSNDLECELDSNLRKENQQTACIEEHISITSQDKEMVQNDSLTSENKSIFVKNFVDRAKANCDTIRSIREESNIGKSKNLNIILPEKLDDIVGVVSFGRNTDNNSDDVDKEHNFSSSDNSLNKAGLRKGFDQTSQVTEDKIFCGTNCACKIIRKKCYCRFPCNFSNDFSTNPSAIFSSNKSKKIKGFEHDFNTNLTDNLNYNTTNVSESEREKATTRNAIPTSKSIITKEICTKRNSKPISPSYNESISEKSILKFSNELSKPRKMKSSGNSSKSENEGSNENNCQLFELNDNIKKLNYENSNINDQKFLLENVQSWMSLNESKNSMNSIDLQQNKIEIVSNASSASSCDEIYSVIREIEDENLEELKTYTNNEKDKNKPKDPIETKEQCHSNFIKETSNEYRDIMSYLEEVEKNCEKVNSALSPCFIVPEEWPESEINIETDFGREIPRTEDLLEIPHHILAKRVVLLSLHANELENIAYLSKEECKNLAKINQKKISQEKSNLSNRLLNQKKNFENVVKRHQEMIDQLLKDKGMLSQKVNALTRRLNSEKLAWEHKLQSELTKAKDLAQAGEKIRREKWVRDNTKRIKELTVKGIEDEIIRMETEHKKKIMELKETYQDEIKAAAENSQRKLENLEKSIREAASNDRESAIENERKLIRDRFESQLIQEQDIFNREKTKLLKEFQVEKEKLLSELKTKEIDFNSKKQKIIEEKDLTIQKIYIELEKKNQQQEEKYQEKIRSIEKQFENDFLVWKNEFESAYKLRKVEYENALRQHYRGERDRQIDAIITKVDVETLKSQEEYVMKITRLKEKYDSEIKGFEYIEQNLKDKCNEWRNKLAESEASKQNLLVEIKQIKLELDHCRKMCDQMLNEKENLKEKIRKEFDMEMACLQSEKDREIQDIRKRIQKTMEKKDATIEATQKENEKLRERCAKLEKIIRQQRLDYVMK